jgi:hypothetical protein
MRAIFFATLIVLSMHALDSKPTALEPRYYTKNCEDLESQKDCEQAARVALFGIGLPVGKGYACAWKGLIKKTCKHTKTAVDFSTPDPSKFTKGIEGCNYVKEEATCNTSLLSRQKKRPWLVIG